MKAIKSNVSLWFPIMVLLLFSTFFAALGMGGFAVAQDDTSPTEVAQGAGEGGILAELAKNETLLNTVFLVVAVIFGMFLVIFYRMSVTKKIVSLQNKKLSIQQEELEVAKAELTKALKQEKAMRETLEKSHETLKSAQAQLIHVEKMSSLGQLTAGIAHEINNPIGFIKGGIQNLKLCIEDFNQMIEGYESIDTEETATMKSQIEDHRAQIQEQLSETREMISQLFKDTLFGTERVTEIVNGLRVFSRNQDAKVKNANLVENIELALMILKHKCKNKAEIVKQFDPNITFIDCFPGQLNQVFINLISNAIDSFKNFGTLVISTHDLGATVQVSFKDNGCGIPDDIKDKVFDPFFSTKEVGEGTGLGLSISHSIIDQHKGKIELFSQVGKGTEFRITLLKKLEMEEDEMTAQSIGLDEEDEVWQVK